MLAELLRSHPSLPGWLREIDVLESDEDVIQRHLIKIFPALFKRAISPMPFRRYFRLPADRRIERSVATVDRCQLDKLTSPSDT